MPKKRKTLTVEELIGAPEYLYHYTTVRGIEGILKNKMVWASVLHFLNDSTEWKYAFELAQIQIMHRLHKLAADAEWNYLLKGLVVSLEHHSWNVCVFSLSAMPNQLSQWRAYCPHEGGYAIRFRTVHLMEQLRAQGFTLSRCEYDPKVQIKRINTVLSSVLDKLPVLQNLRHDRMRFAEVIHSTKSEVLNQIALIAPTLKHPDFQEESEWRAVKMVVYANDSEMDYHIKGAMAVSYYRLRLNASTGEFPIDEITVGPGPHQDLANRGLGSIVDQARVRIKVSQTPLRNL